jgi:hypothetical protein
MALLYIRLFLLLFPCIWRIWFDERGNLHTNLLGKTYLPEAARGLDSDNHEARGKMTIKGISCSSYSSVSVFSSVFFAY